MKCKSTRIESNLFTPIKGQLYKVTLSDTSEIILLCTDSLGDVIEGTVVHTKGKLVWEVGDYIHSNRECISLFRGRMS